MNKSPKLTLVGAGPGDPELITLKGKKALEQADVILYDALAHPNLLNFTRNEAVRVFVGKKAGNHTFTQDEINIQIVEYAKSNGHVVRLKGGDPFIFGRGWEELDFAEKHGLETEAIPGISSISLPGFYGIPLTQRNVNQSFWVITATNSEGNLSSELELAAETGLPAVIFMGLKKLPEIVRLYQKFNRGESAVSIISKGSHPDGTTIRGTVDSIIELISDQEIKSPALIVVNDVNDKGVENGK